MSSPPACLGGPGKRLSGGDGAKGHRWYDWAWVTISHPRPRCQHLLIRRNRSTGERAFYRCYSPQPVALAALVTVAGLRWNIENFRPTRARPRRAPGTPLDLLVPVGHPGHACRCSPHHHSRPRTRPRHRPVRPDPADPQHPADPQRHRSPARQHHHQPSPQRLTPDAPVKLAPPPPAPRPDQPLQAANSPRPRHIL